jgi:hypothetical protein
MNWQSETGELLVSDVVEWTEAIWPPKKPRSRKKSRQWGEQKVTAQITEIDGEFIKLTILKSEITENLIGSDLKSYKVGTPLTKKRATLLRGNPHRLRWSEEDVRSALTKESYQRT